MRGINEMMSWACFTMSTNHTGSVLVPLDPWGDRGAPQTHVRKRLSWASEISKFRILKEILSSYYNVWRYYESLLSSKGATIHHVSRYIGIQSSRYISRYKLIDCFCITYRMIYVLLWITMFWSQVGWFTNNFHEWCRHKWNYWWIVPRVT